MYIIIIDLSSTPETMIDAIRHTAKEMTSKVIASISIVGTALLILLKPGVSTANEGVKNEIAQVLKQFPVKEVQIKTVEEDNSQTYILDQ